MGLSCFRCQPLSYHSIFVNYQPLSYDFGCQPLLCTCVLCTVYCCTVLCTGIVYILGQSCFAVNLFYDFGCQPLLCTCVLCTVYCSVHWCTVHTRSVMLGCQPFFYDFGCQPLLCTCLLCTGVLCYSLVY